jgi:hypothetical protein
VDKLLSIAVLNATGGSVRLEHTHPEIQYSAMEFEAVALQLQKDIAEHPDKVEDLQFVAGNRLVDIVSQFSTWVNVSFTDLLAEMDVLRFDLDLHGAAYIHDLYEQAFE